MPSSLTHGELAINVDNGALFYGTSGSSNAVSSSFLLSHISSSTITASGEISASGNVYGNNIIASGDLYANDKLFINSKEALEDTGTTLGINEQGQFSDGVVINRGNLPQPLTITGNTTASGNISASGNLFIGDVLNSNGINTIGFSTITDSVNIGPNTTTPIKIHGNVTASGDISASGTITATEISASIISASIYGDISSSGFISASGDIMSDGNMHADGFYFNQGDNEIETQDGFEFSTISEFISKINNITQVTYKPTGLRFHKPITASGDISSSGTIRAKAFSSDSDDSDIDFSGSIDVEGSITASGNITASGDIFGDDFYVGGGTYGKKLVFHGDTSTGNFITSNGINQIDTRLSGNIKFKVTQGGIESSGNITSSNNISGSGALIIQDITGSRNISMVTGSFYAVSASDDIHAEEINTTEKGLRMNFGGGNGEIVVIDTSGDARLDIGNPAIARGMKLRGKNIELESPVTASSNLSVVGELSASATVTASILKVVDGAKITYNTGSGGGEGGGGNTQGDIVKFGDATTVPGAIYAFTGSSWSMAHSGSNGGASASLAVAIGTNSTSARLGFFRDFSTSYPTLIFNTSDDAHFAPHDADMRVYMGSQGGDFGGNSSNNLRPVGTAFYQNSGGGNFVFERAGTGAGYIDAGGFNDGSDEALKKDIADITYGLDTVKSLKPRKFKWKSNSEDSIGFIAQEVESIIPEVVSESNVSGTPTSFKGLSYGHLTAVLVKAIQELEARVKELEG